ncbi:hypothetical protein D3C74_366630 [compost metagenome]
MTTCFALAPAAWLVTRVALGRSADGRTNAALTVRSRTWVRASSAEPTARRSNRPGMLRSSPSTASWAWSTVAPTTATGMSRGVGDDMAPSMTEIIMVTIASGKKSRAA